MGAQQTKLSYKDKDRDIQFLRLIDSIASKYILTQNFYELKNLQNTDYCNKLTILTSDILANRLTIQEIEYLNQRTKQGEVVDEMKKAEIMYLSSSDAKKLDIQNTIKKKRMCIGISKFYIKIAHLFSAIVSTINPTYKYRDENGRMVSVSYDKKNTVPEKFRGNLQLKKINLCSRRINSILINELKEIDQTGNLQEKDSKGLFSNVFNKSTDVSLKDKVELKNSVCNINQQVSNKESGEKKYLNKTLMNEPGIPELLSLYFDVYDYNSGKFISMSEKSKEAYNKDLKLFYSAFTGNKNMPSEIKSFSDIKLRDYQNSKLCSGDNPPLKRTYTINKNTRLYKILGEKIRIMNENTQKNQRVLIDILNQIFVYRINPETKNKEISLNPKINEEILDSLIEKTRNIIINLYVNCENDYLKTLEVFEALIEEQIKKNNIRRIENIEKQKQKIISEF